MCINQGARGELLFWQNSIGQLNGQPIWYTSSTTRVAFSDASSTGYGGYVVEIGCDVAQGTWSKDEATLSSTWRELKAVDQVLRSYAAKLRGHRVRWFSDNQNVVRVIQVGSRKEHLQDGAMSIYEVCMRYGIKLEVDWIPRSLNDKADYLSRIIDYDDWKICSEVFHYLYSMWGPHAVHNFASPSN